MEKYDTKKVMGNVANNILEVADGEIPRKSWREGLRNQSLRWAGGDLDSRGPLCGLLLPFISTSTFSR